MWRRIKMAWLVLTGRITVVVYRLEEGRMALPKDGTEI